MENTTDYNINECIRINLADADFTEKAMETAHLDYRMYTFVLKALSREQMILDVTQSVVNYLNRFGELDTTAMWSHVDKKHIILEGGTAPVMTAIFESINERDINCATYENPNLNGIITAISLIVDERVFDSEKYPGFIDWVNKKYPDKMYISGQFEDIRKEYYATCIGSVNNQFLRNLFKPFKTISE